MLRLALPLLLVAVLHFGASGAYSVVAQANADAHDSDRRELEVCHFFLGGGGGTYC